jgi:hypothetical protein
MAGVDSPNVATTPSTTSPLDDNFFIELSVSRKDENVL